MFLVKLIRRSVFKQKINVAVVRHYNDIKFEDIPDISSVEIRKVLKKNNISYEEGYTCYIICCPACHKNKSQKAVSSKIYINKTTGMVLCSYCQYMGQWHQFEKYLSAKKSKDTQLNILRQGDLKSVKDAFKKIIENTNQMKMLDEETFENVLKNFSLPEVPLSSIKNIDIRIDVNKTSLYFPLENVLSETIGFRKIDSLSKKETTEPNPLCSGVITSRNIRNKDTAILVPYIKDFLVLLSSKVPASIVCLPNGLVQLPQHILPSLERFSKLILWFGNDVTSWDTARNFAKKLGEKRCLFVRPTDQQLLPSALPPNQDLKAVVMGAQPIWHKSITTFSTLRQDVLSDLQNIEKVQGIKWKRYPTLNKILKGHRRGELTVITGPTGSGKTTFISEYSLDLAMQGVSTLWGSFEIRNARLARTMLQQMSGIPLDENLHMFDFWANQFEQLPIYFMTFHGQQTLKIVMEAVEHATYVHDITHVIIDNLQFMMGMTEGDKHLDRFWMQDTIVAAFRTFATRKNCHVTLVIHPRKERSDEDLTTSSIFGGAKASQEADNVLIIQDKRLVSIRGKKFIQVVKNRFSGDLGIMPLDFDKSALSYAQKKKKAEGTKEEFEK